MRSSAIDLLFEPVGRTTQTLLMTNRSNTLTVISCSAKLRETATFFVFFSARQEGQIAHRSLELPNREFDFLAAQHNSVSFFSVRGGESFKLSDISHTKKKKKEKKMLLYSSEQCLWRNRQHGSSEEGF